MTQIQISVTTHTEALDFELVHPTDADASIATIDVAGVQYSVRCAEGQLATVQELLERIADPEEPIDSVRHLSNRLQGLDNVVDARQKTVLKAETAAAAALGGKPSLLKRVGSAALKALKVTALFLGCFVGVTPIYFTVKWIRNRKPPLEPAELLANYKIPQALDKYDKRLKKDPNDNEARQALATYGFSAGEWTAVRKQEAELADPFYGSDILFTPLEIHALNIMSRKEKQHHELDAHDKTVLKQFFAHITGNNEFNARITQLWKAQPTDYNQWRFGSNSLAFLREYSFKSHNLDKLKDVSERFAQVATLVEEYREQEVTQKLTLGDFRLADTFGNCWFAMDWLCEFDLWTEDDNPVVELKTAIETMEANVNKINDRFDREHTCNTGDIILDTMAQSTAYDNKSFEISNKVDWMLKLQNGIFGHKFVHAAIGLESDQGYKMAEIDRGYQDPLASFSRLCIAKMYRFDFEKLIKRRTLANCRRNLKILPEYAHLETDEDMARMAEKMYNQAVAEFLADDERFENIVNDQWRQAMTVLQGHMQSEGIDPSKIDFEAEQAMICSEFTGLMLVHCLDRVDEMLHAELHRGLVAKHPRLQLAPDEEVFKRGKLFEHPISRFEKFSALHIDRLYECLADYTEPVQLPEFLDYIVEKAE